MGRRSVTGGVTQWRDKVRLDFYYQGERLKPTLDLKWNERNRKSALRLVDEIKTKIRHGIFDPAAYFPEFGGLARLGVARKQSPSFREVAEEWLASEKDLAYSTRLSYRRALDGYWLPKLGDEAIAAILPSDVKLAVADLNAKNRNNVLIPCRRAFAFAVDDQIIDRSPCETIRNSKVQKDPPDPFDLGELDTLLKDVARHDGEEAADYFEFAFFTGLRASEQIALRWPDYDRGKGLLRVQRARVWGQDKPTTKTHHVRDIELLERAGECLQRQRPRTALANKSIFHNPRTGEPWADEQVQRRILDAAIRRTGIRHRAPKQTRHTFATMCLMAGANPAWVARQLGHASSKMLFEVYSRWIEGADKGLERGKVEAWIKRPGRKLLKK
jgi:integrase